MADNPIKQTLSQKRKAARLRQAAKRDADKSIKAPTVAQITMALGHGVRAAIAAERLSDAFLQSGELPDHLDAIVRSAMDRLREQGFQVGRVTASRLKSATHPDAYITPSSHTENVPS